MARKHDFYMEFDRHIKLLDDPEITEQEILHNKVYATGAYAVYRHLHKNRVGRTWDSKLVEKFYNNNILVSRMSIRKLAKVTGFGTQKVQKLIKQLKEAGWIRETDNRSVYIIGYWEGEDVNYKEHFYSNAW